MSKVEELYIEALYNDFLENSDSAGDEAKEAYNEFRTATENYVAAIQEDLFKKVYLYIKEHDGIFKSTSQCKVSDARDIRTKTVRQLAEGSETKIDAVCAGYQYGYIQGIKAAEAVGYIDGQAD